MGQCIDCRSEAKVNGGKIEAWRYQKIDEPCESCPNDYSHKQVH